MLGQPMLLPSVMFRSSSCQEVSGADVLICRHHKLAWPGPGHHWTRTNFKQSQRKFQLWVLSAHCAIDPLICKSWFRQHENWSRLNVISLTQIVDDCQQWELTNAMHWLAQDWRISRHSCRRWSGDTQIGLSQFLNVSHSQSHIRWCGDLLTPTCLNKPLTGCQSCLGWSSHCTLYYKIQGCDGTKCAVFFNIVQKAVAPPPPFIWALCGEFFWRNFNKSA